MTEARKRAWGWMGSSTNSSMLQAMMKSIKLQTPTKVLFDDSVQLLSPVLVGVLSAFRNLCGGKEKTKKKTGTKKEKKAKKVPAPGCEP